MISTNASEIHDTFKLKLFIDDEPLTWFQVSGEKDRRGETVNIASTVTKWNIAGLFTSFAVSWTAEGKVHRVKILKRKGVQAKIEICDRNSVNKYKITLVLSYLSVLMSNVNEVSRGKAHWIA